MRRPPGTGFILRSDAQAKLTLSRMRELVRAAIQNDSFVTWARAEMMRYSGSAIERRDWQAVARGVRDYVARSIRFAPDPVGIESLTSPLVHQKLLSAPGRISPLIGDCDDAATLAAALGMAVGIPATFTVRAFFKPDNPFQHVLTTLTPRNGSPVECDTTRDAQRLPPIATRELITRV